jgi:pantoate--beta-alanine ligase
MGNADAPLLEIEMKFPVADFTRVERRLAEWGASADPPREDADHYYNAPDRDFARTDEALRLRRIGPANLLTYKGPKLDPQTKTRAEVEITLSPGDQTAGGFDRLAQHLGYRPTAVVRKRRRIHHLTRGEFALEICLDEVEHVGRFVELEILAPQASLAQARALLMSTAAELGLGESERRSYLEMLLQKQGQAAPAGVPVAATVEEVRKAVAAARRRGLTVGLVPTMGALHAGHASLIRTARAETGFVVVSIFVNPTQFGPAEDFERYPRPLQADLELCAREGVDLIFHPDRSVMYPQGYCTWVTVEQLQDVLCGASRPGHFRGVATVVAKLFNIVGPDVAYFGQKDAQQVRLIEQMAADLNMPVRIRRCPTVREPDGLALSSRNRYLDPDQRRQATVLHQALEEVRRRVDAGERDADVLRQALKARVDATPGARLDYAAVVDFNTLRPVDRVRPNVLVALAVHFGTTRLIDNILLE